ncbi:gluconokinase [Thalassospira sp.]|uniref:gluconokinase n=1 Tax=Thalassospira sp. TaxID=1912094 RepID=UPI001B09F979|nr:gluconokinase [Thalassospira sp.]MBO6809343.1 gluconokinase [Thalassospira sp.]MBO6841922.1 gluconokinase [Thalassospira sp.]
MHRQAHYVVIMGVAGSGKTEVTRRIAEATGDCWLDADDYHPVENVEHMRRGQPLNDDMRWPWLSAVADGAHTRSSIDDTADARTDGAQKVFIACSALKRRYRDFLCRKLDPVTFVFLDGTRDVIQTRLERRVGHFMPSALLDSQLADLEPPGPDENCVTVSIDAPIDTVVAMAIDNLAAHENSGSSTVKDNTAGKPELQGEDK